MERKMGKSDEGWKKGAYITKILQNIVKELRLFEIIPQLFNRLAHN